MPNKENLIPAKKGEVRNPKGKPKGTLNRSTIVKKWLSYMDNEKNPITGQVEALTQEDMITLAAILKAKKGDIQAYAKLMEHAYPDSISEEVTIKVVRPNDEK